MKRERRHDFTNIIDAWAQARKMWGDDVAQEAAKVSYAAGERAQNAAYFFKVGLMLARQGYSDGADIKRSDGKRSHGLQLADVNEWAQAVSYMTPEKILLLREELQELHPDLQRWLMNEIKLPPTTVGYLRRIKRKEAQVRRVIELYKQGLSTREVATKMGMSRSFVADIVNDQGISRDKHGRERPQAEGLNKPQGPTSSRGH